ncbi:hypothetical protein OJAV_G00039300 [Oryzias javanicus]|uniref:Uncharacterized protein n=1 Tax=Oryzias javanicus TaxID=123683 RepID=A0A437DCY1_ORYJA|nr:hypothetical protein OJAV_G00039300 [Oryzias javanicus]
METPQVTFEFRLLPAQGKKRHKDQQQLLLKLTARLLMGYTKAQRILGYGRPKLNIQVGSRSETDGASSCLHAPTADTFSWISFSAGELSSQLQVQNQHGSNNKTGSFLLLILFSLFVSAAAQRLFLRSRSEPSL